MRKILYAALGITLGLANSSAFAQEKCYTESKKEINDWISANDNELEDIALLMEKARAEGKKPDDVMMNYKGMEMPISAAYIIVHKKYDTDSKVVVEKAVDKSRICAKDVALPREAYDVAREYLGLTTVLPEAATRVDFAELKDGNVFGSSDALVPKGLEDARKTAEKALKDLGNTAGKAGEDTKRTIVKALKDLSNAADPSKWRW